MSAPRPRTPSERPENALPAEMSLAEKLACEREARHDVAARGRIADAAPVQHYLTHTRCEDGLHPSTSGERRRPHAPHERRARTGLSGWLRWGEDGPAGESPHFPPV
jgi:hypothetical protein